MQVPICGFDAKNAVLCPQCESKVESGDLTKADVDASIILARLAKTHPQIDQFTLHGCKEIDGNFILRLSKQDIQKIRQSRTLYGLIQGEFSGKIWLVEEGENNKRFIEDLFFPTKVLSINSVWAPGGIEKTKAVISGKWTPRFPIDVEKVSQIVKNARNLDIEIEFEESRRN
ncbi:MAG: transcription elongation factor NusA [Crenarchaeota archaeon]|nr:MAG: transcription elongation factor NusA [Thermoproteota archaeon]RDJ32836.1 MAG: transcription elongation factor NusA [Thermoproteota archaeon]RDJ38004.1 MAG: transcription elongation factor NusA [Thermoproteota archaeon]RDJ38332.1 MAG: transcription elongation factor NusA [Thermoproteota archaeon]